MHYIGLTVFRSVARYSPKLSLEIELVASGVEHLSAALGCENQHLHKMTEWIAILDSGLPQCGDLSIAQHAVARLAPLSSAERRVGKECVSKCRSRWSPVH